MYDHTQVLPEEQVERAVLHIDGMSCGHCLNAVNRALTEMPGVEVDTVRMGRAEVRYDQAKVSPAQLEAAVADAGYRATVQP
jgi:copper chaperone CopZ